MRRHLHDISTLLDQGTRARFVVAMCGSVVVAGIEIAGLALVFPLLQLLTSSTTGGSALDTVSSVFGHPSQDRLIALLAGCVVASFVLRTLLTIALNWWTLGFTLECEARMAARLLDLYLRAPYRYHLQRNSAVFLRTIQDANQQAFVMSVASTVDIVTEGAVIIGTGAVLLVFQPVIALSAAVYFGLIIVVYQRIINHRAQRLGREYQELSAESYQAIQQALGGVKEVMVRTAQPYFVARLARAKLRAAQVQRRYQFFESLPRQYLEMAFILGAGALGLVLAASGSDEILAVLGLFVAAGFRLLPTLYRFVRASTTFRTGLGAVDVVCGDLREFESAISEMGGAGPAHEPLPLPPAGESGGEERIAWRAPTRVLRPLRTSLTLNDLSFAYEGSDLVLDGVSMRIERGESVALVGSSGAGKSTLVDLVLGLHRPLSGTIEVDGVNIFRGLGDWQRQIGLVPQDVYLLDASIRENVAFGVPPSEIDDERVRSVIDSAELGELLDELPEGDRTVVGERGVRLSGGQRQRLGVARALYTAPHLLVLDEATSALDNLTEAHLSETIRSFKGTVTMIVIAHRLSTVKNCDRIFFLERGRIMASGTFEELVASNAQFAELAELARLP